MSFDVPVNGRLRDISESKVCPVNPLRVSENLRLTDRNISDSCKKLETNKRLTSFFQSCWRLAAKLVCTTDRTVALVLDFSISSLEASFQIEV